MNDIRGLTRCARILWIENNSDIQRGSGPGGWRPLSGNPAPTNATPAGKTRD
ncbi:hypothetical protein FA13DRAFT_1740692 [Coprinellus micaceus]|uniref:Uncharacterized protein n=1 Tax=Coprinellus micaceus TaxID=71717 RepID=A0A4Y7SLK9_COPMI|nr:hypothetical protein FA13DRAFT_1740692 [Coprinellus micaceus]